VVTRRPDYAAPGAIVTHSIDEALSLAAGDEVFVAGGEDVFRQTLDRADRIHLTRIDRDYPGDTFFPEFDESGWELVEREDHAATETYPAFSFETWERRAAT
jgi:dihydrofolate reductase